MPTNHVVIWIDHKEAHVLYFDRSKSIIIKSQSVKNHLYHKAMVVGDGNAPIDHAFFHAVISTVADVNEILIVGPSSAKIELKKHADHHDPLIAKKIIGVETLDHPTDGQVLAYAMKYSQRIDQMNGT